MPWNYALIDRLVEGRAKDRWLLDHPSVAKAIAAAWGTADPAGRRGLIAALLARQTTANGVMLIRRCHELDPDSQAELARRIDQLHKPLRQVLNQDDKAGLFNAITLIGNSISGGLAYLITPKLRHTDPVLRERAGWCLLSLSGRANQMQPSDVTRLAEALGEAVVRYGNHEHPAALRAWLSLGSRSFSGGTENALAALQDPNHPAVPAMRQLLKQNPDAQVRRGLVGALALPTLALAAVAGLRGCAANNTLGQAIADTQPFLDLPAVRKGLNRAGEPAELLPSAEDLEQLCRATEPTDDQAWAAWIAALPATPLAQATRLSVLLKHPAATTRHAAVARLIAIIDPAASGARSTSSDAVAAARSDPRVIAEVTRGLTHVALQDLSPAIARFAATWLLAQDHPEPNDVLETLSTSDHALVQRAANRKAQATAFDRLWRRWPRLDRPARVDAVRTTVRQDPSTPRRLKARLTRGGTERQRALEIVTLVDQLAPLRRPPSRGSALTGGAA